MRLPPTGHVDQPAYALIQAIIAYWGTATANGNALGTTIVDAGLVPEPSYEGHKVKLLAGDAAGQERDIIAHPAGTNTATVDAPFTDNAGAAVQVLAGTSFVIIGRGSQETLDAILAIVSALLVLTETGGTVNTTGAEQDVYINNAPAGVYEPKKVLIDFTNQTAAETVVIRTYYRIRAGGALVLEGEVTYAGVQNPPLINVELEPNRFGTRVSMQRTAGGAFAYDWEALYEA